MQRCLSRSRAGAGPVSRRPRRSEELTPADTAHKAELDADVDSLLDEIDSVLESNAEEFVRSFVQKGGQ